MTERNISHGLKKEVEEEIEKKLSRSSGSKSPEDFDSYHDWISHCMKEKGGGSDSMSKCAKEWRGEDTSEGGEKTERRNQDEEKKDDKLQKLIEEGVQTYLITNKNCPGCKLAKERLSEQLGYDVLETIDMQEDNLAADIAIELDIKRVPMLVVELESGEICKIDENGGVGKCAEMPKE